MLRATPTSYSPDATIQWEKVEPASLPAGLGTCETDPVRLISECVDVDRSCPDLFTTKEDGAHYSTSDKQCQNLECVDKTASIFFCPDGTVMQPPRGETFTETPPLPARGSYKEFFAPDATEATWEFEGCYEEDWRHQMDGSGYFSPDLPFVGCKNGYAMAGMDRSGDDELYALERAWCCPTAAAIGAAEYCFEQEIVGAFDDEGWVACPDNVGGSSYMKGLRRSANNQQAGNLVAGWDSMCIPPLPPSLEKPPDTSQRISSLVFAAISSTG